MSAYHQKEHGFEELVTLTSDENDICTLRRVVTTVPVNKHSEVTVVLDETYRRMPRGSVRDRRWQYQKDDGFWFCNDRDVPTAVKQAWIYLAKPIPESKKPRRERQSLSNPTADAAAIAAYWEKAAETVQ